MVTRKPPADPAGAEQETAKPRVFASAVHVDGRWYYAGDEAPADVAAQINNESVWAAE